MTTFVVNDYHWEGLHIKNQMPLILFEQQYFLTFGTIFSFIPICNATDRGSRHLLTFDRLQYLVTMLGTSAKGLQTRIKLFWVD